MINHILVTLVDSVLGSGKKTSNGNYAYHCPFCNHHKPKLEVNFTENKKGDNPWHCWVCNNRGKSIFTLLKKAEASPEKIAEARSYIKKGYEVENAITINSIKLPNEFTPLYPTPTGITAKHALAYLGTRGITTEDIIKYNIGFCEYGDYSNMIIIPSYNAGGSLNFFVGRSFLKDPYKKYKNPSISKDIIPFELFINWDSPIVLCEGPFDAISIKRNAIPLLGKHIQNSLMKKIISSKVEQIYIALDKDAQKDALDFCEKFMNEGKEVHLLELNDKDPSEMGFNSFINLLHHSQPLTLSGLLSKKLNL